MCDLPKLKKREWDALGTLLLPLSLGGGFKLGPKTGTKLEAMGLVEKTDIKIPARVGEPAWTAVVLHGYRLTEKGHRLYCEWASTQELDEEC